MPAQKAAVRPPQGFAQGGRKHRGRQKGKRTRQKSGKRVLLLHDKNNLEVGIGLDSMHNALIFHVSLQIIARVV